jgi:hypothetical protein
VTDKTFGTIVRLIEEAEQAAASTPDLANVLAQVVRLTVEADADPYLVLGVMVEGIAYALSTRIPAERQRNTVEDLRLLLDERLAAHGVK